MKRTICAVFLALAVAGCNLFSSESDPPTIDDAIAAYEQEDYAKAYDVFLPLAEDGDVEAQFRLAQMYHYGQGVAQSYSEAARWYRRAAEQNHTESQAILGKFYLDGTGVQRDYEESARWIQLAVIKNHPEARFHLGIMCYHGLGREEDHNTAYTLFEPLADSGHIGSAYYVGLYHLQQRNPETKEETVRWLTFAAEGGYADAQYELGKLYHQHDSGVGPLDYVSTDIEEAFRWLVLAAEQGHIDAQVYLGEMYMAGRGELSDYDQYDFPRDYGKAVYWLRRAAENGHRHALFLLGICYFRGWGVQSDSNEAQRLLSVSVALATNEDLSDTPPEEYLRAIYGDPEAQCNIGYAYYRGFGLFSYIFLQSNWQIRSNYEEAVLWLTRAAEQRYVNAFSQLGDFYESGQFMRDFVKAYMWYTIGIEHGASVGSSREQVAIRMTPEQIAEAQLLADEWLAAHPPNE